MIIYGIFKLGITLLKFFFGWVYISDFGLTETFAPYITWFISLLDNVTSLIAFLIPRPVFISSILLFFAIHNLEHFLEMINAVLSKLPRPFSVSRILS